MNSQCGSFKFRGRKIRGCMLTCSDALCNGAPGRVSRLFNPGFYTGLTGLIPYNSMLMEILLGIRVCNKLFRLLFYSAYLKFERQNLITSIIYIIFQINWWSARYNDSIVIPWRWRFLRWRLSGLVVEWTKSPTLSICWRIVMA